MWTTTKRLIFVLLLFQFRGWGLYVFLNAVEDIVLSSSIGLRIPGIVRETPDLGSCWYMSLLKSWQQSKIEDNSCYGHPFDFSDHVVLFFSHSFPSMIFEASFCFLFPFLPDAAVHWRTTGKEQDGRKRLSAERTNALLRFFFNTVLPILLLLVFLYLNVITLLAIHSTAAYFHTIGEVIAGYLISLIVQLPVGWIIWADEWTRIRRLVGFPIDREHTDWWIMENCTTG